MRSKRTSVETFLVCTIWMDLSQTCTNIISLGDIKELIYLGDLDLIFKVTWGQDINIYLVCSVSPEWFDGYKPYWQREIIGRCKEIEYILVTFALFSRSPEVLEGWKLHFCTIYIFWYEPNLHRYITGRQRRFNRFWWFNLLLFQGHRRSKKLVCNLQQISCKMY